MKRENIKDVIKVEMTNRKGEKAAFELKVDNDLNTECHIIAGKQLERESILNIVASNILTGLFPDSNMEG